jgi:catechol 2,3-dioxygenase-like lactoylglutathione lyase family enzyme
MSLGEIRNLDYAILLCNKIDETRAFYRDVMKFPIETDRPNWVSFRVGAALLTLRPRGKWAVCDDGTSAPGSAAVQLAFRVPPPAVDACHAELVAKGVPILRGPTDLRTGVTARCSSAIPRTTSSRYMRSTRAWT